MQKTNLKLIIQVGEKTKKTRIEINRSWKFLKRTPDSIVLYWVTKTRLQRSLRLAKISNFPTKKTTCVSVITFGQKGVDLKMIFFVRIYKSVKHQSHATRQIHQKFEQMKKGKFF